MKRQFFLVLGADDVTDLRFDYNSAGIGVLTPNDRLVTSLVRNIGIDIFLAHPKVKPICIAMGLYYCPSYDIGEKLNWNVDVCKQYVNIIANSTKARLLAIDKKAVVAPISRSKMFTYIKPDYKAKDIHPAELRAYLHFSRYILAYYESLQTVDQAARKEVFKKRILTYEEWQEQKLRELLGIAEITEEKGE